MARELDMLKEIPGYKAILKSVLKSQIQMLVSKSECIVQIEFFFSQYLTWGHELPVH